MNRVVFLSSILWASVSLGGVITEPDPPRPERYGTIEFPEPFSLLQGIMIPKSESVAYIDLLGTATSIDLASNIIVDGGVSGNYKVELSVPGQDLGNGFTRFDLRGMGVRNTKDGLHIAKVIIHGGSAPAVVQNILERWQIVSEYYVPDGTFADNPGLPAIPIGGAWVGVATETLDPPYGDANQDGRIDLSDFGLLVSGFSRQVTPYTNGDVSGDGWVQIDDFGILKQNFGWHEPVAAVPEPSTLGLLGLGILFFVLGKIVPRVVVR